jgi:hypothetical protein
MPYTPPFFVVGLDLGQVNDFSAACVLEVTRAPDPVRPERLVRHHAARYLKRWPLGTPYPDIVGDVARVLATAPLPGAPLVVDQTGVGRPVVDMLRRAKMPARLVPVTITAGTRETQTADGWHVPKVVLVSSIQVLLQQRRLRFAAALAERRTLEAELAGFRVRLTAAAHETYGADDWRAGANDDLVLSLGLGAWYGERMPALGSQRRPASALPRQSIYLAPGITPLGYGDSPWRDLEA